MSLEPTKEIIEEDNPKRVNDLLRLGWTLIGLYVKDQFAGEKPPVGRDETAWYILAWQQDGEPQHHSKQVQQQIEQSERLWQHLKRRT